MSSIRKHQNLTGKRFGKLVAYSHSYYRTSNKDKNRSHWLCKCDCGELSYPHESTLLKREVNSCGCLVKKSGGFNQSKTYTSWEGIKGRCYNKNNDMYYLYGGRGISMCEEWKNSFLCFIKDMGEAPIGKSIDRIDNNKGYYKENCRWATPKEQAWNTRRTIMIEFRGKKQLLSYWAKELGFNRQALTKRLKKMTIEEAFTVPKQKRYLKGTITNNY